MEGYGPGNVSILRCDEDIHESHQKPPDCGDVPIFEDLGLTGCPSKQVESSSRITTVEYKRTCQLLPTQTATKLLKQ